MAVGPSLKILGHDVFAEYNLPITLPYAWVSSLPGLGFMRTPGRFMYTGFVALGICAAFGLAWLAQRAPKMASALPMLAILLILLEAFPAPWSHEPLRPVANFYKQLAQDPDQYGVLDLPAAASPSRSYIDHSSFYQMDQMMHGKGIASGYLSRTYLIHPVFQCFIPPRETAQPDVRINGRATDCYDTAPLALARAGYRYVVFHKPVFQRQSEKKADKQVNDETAYAQAREFIANVFPGKTPDAEDELVQAYQVPELPAPSELPTTVQLGPTWFRREKDLRWAFSPAELVITSPRQQSAVLEILPALMFDASSPNGMGKQGMLVVQTSDSAPVTFAVQTNEPVTIPVELAPGFNTISLALAEGNFHPTAYGGKDPRTLSFSVRSVNLKLEP
jgi:hypothetical protein